MKKLKIGLIGMGRIGRLHGNNLSKLVPYAELCAVADPYLTEEGRAWAEELGVPYIYQDADEIFSNPEIDAVFICSSTATHADYIGKAAQAGKHIFCEKPIDLDVEKIQTALQAVEKCGVKLQVGFVRRFDKNHKAVRDTVVSGKLGKPHVIKITSRDPEPPSEGYIQSSGGIFVDMMIHDFDMARYLSGSDVTEVTATGAVLVDPVFAKYGDVDTAIVTLKFANGAIGVIDNSRAARYGYDQRVEVHCDKGCVSDENVRESSIQISTADGVEQAKPTWFFLERYNDAFVEEEKAFVQAVLEDLPTPVTGLDGLYPVLIAQAAAQSLAEKRTIILERKQ